HLALGDVDHARPVPEMRPVLLHPGRAGDDVLVHQRRAELRRRHRAERGLHRGRHGARGQARSCSQTSIQAWVVRASDSTSTRSSFPWKPPAMASAVSVREKRPKPYATAPLWRKYGASVKPTILRGSRRAPG